MRTDARLHASLLLAWGLLVAIGPALADLAGAMESPDPLVDIGSFAEESPPPPERLRLVSYNLHGPPTERISEMIELLKTHPVIGPAPVLILQEVNRDHSGSGNKDMARELARALKMHYAYAVEIEHGKGGGVRGLAILSRYPLSEVKRVQLPVKGPGGRRRIALAANINLGEKALRVYSLHLETRISVENRARQIGGLVDDAEGYRHLPVAVMGDFNTITSGATQRMFEVMEEAGFSCPLKGDKKTFKSHWVVRMKLDWIWLRGLDALEADVESGVSVSDHRPLWVDIDLSEPPQADKESPLEEEEKTLSRNVVL